MTASEFVFLALGLVLGVAAGAALVEIIRARPPAAREVRVTVATDAIPRRRATTLADDAFVGGPASAEPARGGPADRREHQVQPGAPGAAAAERRAPVRPSVVVAATRPAVPTMAGTEGVGEGVSGRPRPGRIQEPAFRLGGPQEATGQAVPISGGADSMMTALRASAAASAVAAMRTVPTRTAVLDVANASVAPHGSAGSSPSAAVDSGTSTSGGTSPLVAEALPGAGPCGEARRLADERCELASRARAQAEVAADAHRAAQRAYDDHGSRTQAAMEAADARAIRAAKDEAQARFRTGRGGATTTEEVEAAARDWLFEINAINARARDATIALQREQAVAQSIALDLERMGLEADVARIAAEGAEYACLAAREALADCEERESGGLPGHLPRLPSMGPDESPDIDEGQVLSGALGAGGTPRIFRLLEGDRSAMQEMVSALAGEDPDARPGWQVAISDLVDAILGDSIAAIALAFPTDHAFWGPFSQSQSRDITGALSSLGYRFDGLGGWVDDRIPSQRDLSLALGYAGLDPMRMRQWPSETEMADLFAEVEVAAADHLAGAAGDLTLGELVSMLGRRADGLAEVWNHWGRIRPLLLEEA